MLMLLSAETVIFFFIYALIGWICEFIYCGIIDKKFENRGFLFGPYCPIYGAGAILIIYILHPVFQSAFWLFVATVVVCTVMEYIVGWAMETVFHMRWWDYSNQPFNLNGRICVLNSTLFGIMGLLLIYFVHPYTVTVLDKIPTQFDSYTMAVCIVVLISIDLTLSTKSLQLAFKQLAELKVYMEQFRASQADRWKKGHVRENIRDMVRSLRRRARNNRLSIYGIKFLNKLRSTNIIENYKLRQMVRRSESMNLRELEAALEALKAYTETEEETREEETLVDALEAAITELTPDPDEKVAR